MPKEARMMEDAIRAALTEGMHTNDIYSDGAVSTEEFTERVCVHLKR
jgi:hypothetical protein